LWQAKSHPRLHFPPFLPAPVAFLAVLRICTKLPEQCVLPEAVENHSYTFFSVAICFTPTAYIFPSSFAPKQVEYLVISVPSYGTDECYNPAWETDIPVSRRTGWAACKFSGAVHRPQDVSIWPGLPLAAFLKLPFSSSYIATAPVLLRPCFRRRWWYSLIQA
jgi:hypothetical protein